MRFIRPAQLRAGRAAFWSSWGNSTTGIGERQIHHAEKSSPQQNKRNSAMEPHVNLAASRVRTDRRLLGKASVGRLVFVAFWIKAFACTLGRTFDFSFA